MADIDGFQLDLLQAYQSIVNAIDGSPTNFLLGGEHYGLQGSLNLHPDTGIVFHRSLPLAYKSHNGDIVLAETFDTTAIEEVKISRLFFL